MYVATFHCPNAILDQWRGGGEKHLKLNCKTCLTFQLQTLRILAFFVRMCRKKILHFFYSKGTSIHSLIIKHTSCADPESLVRGGPTLTTFLL